MAKYFKIDENYMIKTIVSLNMYYDSIKTFIRETASNSRNDVYNEAMDDIRNERYEEDSVREWERDEIADINEWEEKRIREIEDYRYKCVNLLEKVGNVKFSTDPKISNVGPGYNVKKEYYCLGNIFEISLCDCEIKISSHNRENATKVYIRGMVYKIGHGDSLFERDFSPEKTVYGKWIEY